MGHQVVTIPKNHATVLTSADGSANGASPGALAAPGSRSVPKAPTSIESAQPRIVM